MFKKEERSSFKYWFAHWCAFQMTALNLGIWKPKYLLHDFEKPWLKMIWGYNRVQKFHRKHASHHIEYALRHNGKFDVDGMIIDNECSRFTKESAPYTAIEWIEFQLKTAEGLRKDIYIKALNRAKEIMSAN